MKGNLENDSEEHNLSFQGNDYPAHYSEEQEINTSFSAVGNHPELQQEFHENIKDFQISPGFSPENFRATKQDKLTSKEEEEEHKAAILHLETVNKIAKYQLVFVKLQSAVGKLCRLAKSKDLLRKQQALLRFQENASKSREAEQVQARNVLWQIKNAVKTLARIKEGQRKVALARFVNRWRDTLIRSKVFRDLNKRLTATEEKFKKELAGKDRAVSALEQKLNQYSAEAISLKESEKSLRQILKEKEDREKSLKDALERLKKRDAERIPKSVEERLQALEAHVAKLESENRELKERLESTENNVGGFIQEVTDILDSQEFIRARGRIELKLEEFDTNESQEAEDEGIMGGGTGGYSKSKIGHGKREVVKMAENNRVKKVGAPKYKI